MWQSRRRSYDGPVTSEPTTDLLRARLTGPALHRALDYFAVQDPDRADFRTAARLIRQDPAALARVRDVVAQLRAGMGRILTMQQAFLPAVFDPQDPREPVEARFFYPVAFAATLPDVLAFHRSRAVPDSASRAVLADLGRHLRVFERTFGHTGLHVQNWFTLHLRGMIYDFGRLQANLQTLDFSPEQVRAAGVPVVPGSVVAGIHIPDSGPLAPSAVDASLARLRPFFDRHFPDFGPLTTAVCSSWLLDEHSCSWRRTPTSRGSAPGGSRSANPPTATSRCAISSSAGRMRTRPNSRRPPAWSAPCWRTGRPAGGCRCGPVG